IDRDRCNPAPRPLDPGRVLVGSSGGAETEPVIHFVVGTRAQLLKLAPVMLECERRELDWRWVYTAQHRDTIQETLATFGLPEPGFVVVAWDTEAKSIGRMSRWFARMLMSLTRSRRILAGRTGAGN